MWLKGSHVVKAYITSRTKEVDRGSEDTKGWKVVHRKAEDMFGNEGCPVMQVSSLGKKVSLVIALFLV